MQMVIEIPEWFKEMIDKGEAPLEFPLFLAYGIQQGIVLPKGHGRLIDADALLEQINDAEINMPVDHFQGLKTAKVVVKFDTSTIIEADRRE